MLQLGLRIRRWQPADVIQFDQPSIPYVSLAYIATDRRLHRCKKLQQNTVETCLFALRLYEEINTRLKTYYFSYTNVYPDNDCKCLRSIYKGYYISNILYTFAYYVHFCILKFSINALESSVFL